MNPFFLQLPPQQEQPCITYNATLFLMGSCFVDNIGNKLCYHKFRTTINPFGIIFHPIALEKLLNRIVNQRLFKESDIFLHNEQWHCFEVHSEHSHSNKDYFLSQLNDTLKKAYLQLKEASHVVFTFGTAWSYLHNESKKVVANCHKIPQREFTKQLTTVSDLQSSFKRSFEFIHSLNPSAHIITTISPVRHIKDGIIENNHSKANLLSALHQSIQKTNGVNYYPAYELVMDCLRDYRFYERDLIHPNQIAIDYIWEHFMDSWIYDAETKKTQKQVAEIQKGISHKAFNPESVAHQKFIKSLEIKVDLLKKEFTFMEFYTHS